MIEQGDELFMRSYQNIRWTEPVVYQCRRTQGTTYRNVYEFLSIQRINKPRFTFLDYARVPNENLRRITFTRAQSRVTELDVGLLIFSMQNRDK